MKRIAILLSLLFLAGCASPPPTRPAARRAGPSRAEPPPERVVKAARVMLLIDEKSLGTIATSEIEAMAVPLLRAADFDVVDVEMVRSAIKKDQALLKSVGDARGAAAAGLEFGAEIVVAGEAVAAPAASRIAESNLRSYEAAVTLRAIRTDNAEVMTSASETASIVALEDVTGGSQALKTAGAAALGKLVAGLKKTWASEGGSARISVSVGGVDQAWKLKAVRECLRGMKDTVYNCLQRSYTAGVVVFDVESATPAEELSEKLVLAPPQGLKFQVLNVSRGKIQLRAVQQ